jgi:rhamnosyltransferase
VTDLPILIVLGAYNGSRFIGEQLDSIRRQTRSDWQLIVRDDGSTDDTRAIVQRFADSDPRIRLLPSDDRRLGVWGNFSELLAHARSSEASYVFLSDQDDVWLESKMEDTMQAIVAAEARHGPSVPMLAHTDLIVSDANLQPIHPSYREFQGVYYDHREPIRTLLIHNAPMACTMLCNRALIDFAVPIPGGVFHDWWLTQCAAAAGAIIDLPTVTVRYRQHGANVIGAHRRHAFVNDLVRGPFAWVRSTVAVFADGVEQGHVLAQHVSDHRASVPSDRVRSIELYSAAFATRNPVKRLRLIRRSRVRPQRRLSHPMFYALAVLHLVWPRGRKAKP